MKKTIFLILSICLSFLLNAQVYKTVNCTTGRLSSILTATELNTITNLTITGAIDARDFKTMKSNMPNLAVLDLSTVTVYEYTGLEGTNSYSNVYFANEIPGYAFYSKSSLISISIPSSVTSIGEWAFSYCTGLTSISIPSSITTIEVFTFYSCTSLTSISIPNSITSIWDGAFNNTSVQITLEGNNPYLSIIDGVLFNMKNNSLVYCPTSKNGSYSIPSFVTDIRQYAFSGCNKLTSIFIPSSVSFISFYSFKNCTGLTAIYAKRTTPAGIIISSGAFYEVDKSNCKLYVPCGSYQNYSTTNYWKDFSNIVEDCSLNSAPVANAGIDKSVNEGLTVILDGSLSFDDNKDALTYKWTAPAGITLSSTTARNPSFKAPQVSINTDYTFSLVVNDGTTDSFADQVVITVNDVNKAPIANAGTDQSVNEGASVSLDGSLSSDPAGNPLTYKWTAPAGITLNSTTATQPTFTAPEVKNDSIIIFSLVVNDGTIDSPPATVKIRVLNVIKVGVSSLNSPLFKVYPNPTTGIINIEFGAGKGSKTEVVVTSLVGSEIFRKETFDASNFQIDLSNQISGVYLLKISNENRQYMSKIVVSSKK